MRKERRLLVLFIAALMLSNTIAFASEDKFDPYNPLHWRKLGFEKTRNLVIEESSMTGEFVKLLFEPGPGKYVDNRAVGGDVCILLEYKDMDVRALYYEIIDAEKLNSFYRVKLGDRYIYIPLDSALILDDYDLKDLREVTVFEGEEAKEDKRFYLSHLRKSGNKPEYLKREIENYKSKLDVDSTFDDKIISLISSMDSLGFDYGGDPYKQLELIDRKTMCRGFVWIAEEFIKQADLIYRFVGISANQLKANSSGHITLEVYNDEDNKWYDIEPTYFSSSNIQKFKAEYKDEWKEELLKNIKLSSKAEETTQNKLRLIKKREKKTEEFRIFVSEEYRRGAKIGDTGYKIVSTNYENALELSEEKLEVLYDWYNK